MKAEYRENLRMKLYEYIIEYGIDDSRTIFISQQLDKYIVREQMSIMSRDHHKKLEDRI